MSRLLKPGTFAYYANHVRAETDRLLARADEQLERINAVAGRSEEAAITQLALLELEEIRRQLERAQLGLVHRADRRYKAAQSLLQATDGNEHRTPIPAEQRAEAA